MGNRSSTPSRTGGGSEGRYFSHSDEGSTTNNSNGRPTSRRSESGTGGNNRRRQTSGARSRSPALRAGRAGSTTNATNGVGDASYDVQDLDSEQESPPSDMSWYQMAKAGYQELVNAIIRPPRAEYEIEALGPVEFDFVGKPFKRMDFRLLNERGHVLECSHWQPRGWRHAAQLPCIVYMHGNSSARVEALPQLSLALSLGATLVAFDFAGSGRSGGEYVSLGYYERDDLKAVVEHLRRSGEVGAIALWGRSMGAATALLHGDRDMSIAALVLDSAFADLTQLAEEMVERGRQAGLTVPAFVVKMVMRLIRGTVAKTAGFNVRDLCPIEHADRTFIPALFVAGRNDDFIRPHHSQKIHDAYAGDKNIVLVEGDHNSPRPNFLFDSVYIFLQNYLQVPLDWGLDRGNTLMGYPPWHQGSGGGGNAAAMLRAAAARHASFDPELTDFVDWDGIGVDDIGVDGAQGVGVTSARQADFQTALFHMLAQERPETTAVSGANGNILSNSSSGSSNTSNMSDRRRMPASSGLSASYLDYTVAVRDSVGERGAVAAGGGATGNHNGNRAGVGDSVRHHDVRFSLGNRSTGVASEGEGDGGDGRADDDDREAAEGAAAVAAVAAAIQAATAAATPAPTSEGGGDGGLGSLLSASSALGFVTPSSLSRPVMAPFSVSDTSSVAASPDVFHRRKGGAASLVVAGGGGGGAGQWGGGGGTTAGVVEEEEGVFVVEEEGGIFGDPHGTAEGAPLVTGEGGAAREGGVVGGAAMLSADISVEENPFEAAELGKGAAATDGGDLLGSGALERDGTSLGSVVESSSGRQLDGGGGGGGDTQGRGLSQGRKGRPNGGAAVRGLGARSPGGAAKYGGFAAAVGGVSSRVEGAGADALGNLDADAEWSCSRCTLINAPGASNCLACGLPRAVGHHAGDENG